MVRVWLGYMESAQADYDEPGRSKKLGKVEIIFFVSRGLV